MRIGCIRSSRRWTAGLAGLFAAIFVAAVAAPLALSGAASASVVLPSQQRRADTGAVTVAAPGAGDHATITVSRTDDLVNQTIAVSWTGFEPSSASRLNNAGDSLDVNTEDPVRVYQCRGTDPSSSDCYGSPGFRGIDATDTTPAVPAVPGFTYPGQTDQYAYTPDGPANWQDNVTRADGTGEVALQLFTKLESAALGCDATTPCSLVVVPNYGRDNRAGDTEDLMDAPWSWARHTTIPLTFLSVDDACPLTGSSLRVEGSPFVASAMASWRAETCTQATDDVLVDYTAIGEPQVRADVTSGTTDVGVLMDPMAKPDATSRGVTYAPLTTTGLVVAFQIDDAAGKPITDLKLNARLVAKLITASYRSGTDPNVLGNPVNIFHDPELLALNPGVQFPSGSPGNHPFLLGDISDSTLALTRWIEADKDARAFLAGIPDPWGMHVNTAYKDLPMPSTTFPVLDEQLTNTFAPIQDLDLLSRQLSIAQFPGAVVTVEDGVNITTKPPRQPAGRREVIGLVDAASAARFRLSTAALENADGKFVQPGVAGLVAGIKHSVVGADGVTRRVDLTDKDPAIYPLTLQLTGVFSTKADADERGQMADLLSYVGAGGQVPGDRVGQLPAGHAPLTAAQLDQVSVARKAVVAGWTAPGGGGNGGDGNGGGDGTDPTDPPGAPPGGGGGAPPVTAGSTPGTTDPSVEPSAAPSASAADLGPTMLTVGPQASGDRMLTLPILGALALAALAAGPLLLWLSRSGRGPQWLRR